MKPYIGQIMNGKYISFILSIDIFTACGHLKWLAQMIHVGSDSRFGRRCHARPEAQNLQEHARGPRSGNFYFAGRGFSTLARSESPRVALAWVVGRGPLGPPRPHLRRTGSTRLAGASAEMRSARPECRALETDHSIGPPRHPGAAADKPARRRDRLGTAGRVVSTLPPY